MITWHFTLTRTWSVSVNLRSVIQLNDKMFTIQRFSTKGLEQLILQEKVLLFFRIFAIRSIFVGAPAIIKI